MENHLFLSDDFVFYTLEGEGRYIGCPSVFMRLAMCNLTCKGFISTDSPFGCDSYVSWSKKNKLTFDEIFDIYEKNDYIDKLKQGALLKITGGEPFIQEKALLKFIEAFVAKYRFIPIIDFETNATLMPDRKWVNVYNATFTTSPKMSNNGDPEDKRYKLDVLRFLNNKNACFKFVIKTESDINEVIEKYVNIGIKREIIWLMPCCGSRDEQTAVSSFVAELCKTHGFKFSPRLQLMIWNKALKV